jgi:hypothetical protein
VLGEHHDGSAFDRGTGVERVGCYLLDDVAMGQQLRLPGGTQGILDAGKFVHGSVTDLTFNRFTVVIHRKPKPQSFEVGPCLASAPLKYSLTLRLTVVLNDSFVERVACMIRNIRIQGHRFQSTLILDFARLKCYGLRPA